MAVPEITQDMINAYDDYTHLTLDRRGFMEKLSKLAGSAAAAAAIAPMLSANQAVAAIVPADDKRLKAEDITYPGAKRNDERAISPCRPMRRARFPRVIVIHENRGLNPHIEDVTRRIALEGFLALAPDFLSGQGGTPAGRGQGARHDRQAQAEGYDRGRRRHRSIPQERSAHQRQGRRRRLLLGRRHRQSDRRQQLRT